VFLKARDHCIPKVTTVLIASRWIQRAMAPSEKPIAEGTRHEADAKRHGAAPEKWYGNVQPAERYPAETECRPADAAYQALEQTASA
jgi:hypothetical protein